MKLIYIRNKVKDSKSFKKYRSALQRIMLGWLLRGGINKTQLSEISGLSVPTVRKLIKEYRDEWLIETPMPPRYRRRKTK